MWKCRPLHRVALADPIKKDNDKCRKMCLELQSRGPFLRSRRDSPEVGGRTTDNANTASAETSELKSTVSSKVHKDGCQVFFTQNVPSSSVSWLSLSSEESSWHPG